MGQSTNGMLVYGYHLGGEDEWLFRETGEYGSPTLEWYREPDDAEDDDFITQAEGRILAANGLTGTWADDDYYERREEAKERSGVELESHCSADYPMWFLAAKTHTAFRGYPEIISDLDVLAKWDHDLSRALEALGITPNDPQPRWHLASYRG